jgi:hypothetical protein
MIRRLGVASLIVLIMSVAFLGFASGDLVRHVWDKHPRHAGSQHAGAPHVAWKNTPGTTWAPAPIGAPPVAGPVHAAAVPVAAPVPARPPFVPPRV